MTNPIGPLGTTGTLNRRRSAASIVVRDINLYYATTTPLNHPNLDTLLDNQDGGLIARVRETPISFMRDLIHALTRAGIPDDMATNLSKILLKAIRITDLNQNKPTPLNNSYTIQIVQDLNLILDAVLDLYVPTNIRKTLPPDHSSLAVSDAVIKVFKLAQKFCKEAQTTPIVVMGVPIDYDDDSLPIAIVDPIESLNSLLDNQDGGLMIRTKEYPIVFMDNLRRTLIAANIPSDQATVFSQTIFKSIRIANMNQDRANIAILATQEAIEITKLPMPSIDDALFRLVLIGCLADMANEQATITNGYTNQLNNYTDVLDAAKELYDDTNGNPSLNRAVIKIMTHVQYWRQEAQRAEKRAMQASTIANTVTNRI